MDLTTTLAMLGLFVLTFVGNGTIPMPVTFYVLWLGQFDMPVAVIVIGTLGTITGWVLMAKYFVRWFPALTSEKMNKNIPGLYRRFFLKSPGWAIFMFNAIPFPWDFGRVMALVYKIEPTSLILPLALGRIIRYALLVYIGVALAQIREILWLVLGLLFIPIILRVGRSLTLWGTDKFAPKVPTEELKQLDPVEV